MRFKTVVMPVFVLVIILSLLSEFDIGTISGFTVLEKPIPEEAGSISVFFCPADDCEGILAAELKQSSSVRCALYDLDLESIESVLAEKDADVLIDEDNYNGYGTEIGGSGLMHNKFCILDDKKVATGSFNPTGNGAYKNNNNLLIIESAYLAENYNTEFYEIKSSGSNKANRYTKVLLSSVLVENYFCPDDTCEKHVIEALAAARHSVRFMTFSFTSDPIGDYLISKKDSLEIKGVFEKSQNNEWNEYQKMKDAGMDVMFDGNKNNMHNKVFIIDDDVVVTGSYNPTNNGNKNNDENILIIHDSTIAGQFIAEFDRVWAEAQAAK